VVRFLSAVMDPATTTARMVWINGQRALRFDVDGELDTIASFDVVDGQVVGIYAVRNPAKLGRVTEEYELSR
jgi:RNA polymerase sigma-70 factor (ECF subfamily)